MKSSDIFSDVTTTAVIALVSARNSVSLSAAVDVRQYDGLGILTLNAEAASAGSSPTLNVKLQESATTDGVYTDVASGAFVQVTEVSGTAGPQKLAVDFNATKGFLKVLPVLGGTASPAFTFGVNLYGRKKMNNTPAAVTNP